MTPAAAWAQLDQGRLTGTVTDAQGAVLPGVTVTATSPSLIGTQTAVTEEDGTLSLPVAAVGHLRAHVRADRLPHGQA